MTTNRKNGQFAETLNIKFIPYLGYTKKFPKWKKQRVRNGLGSFDQLYNECSFSLSRYIIVNLNSLNQKRSCINIEFELNSSDI